MSKICYSFIIPHHNSLNLLNRCISSIPQRDDIEIIVVDDNSSPEERPSLLRSDVKIIYISENESKGAGKARNVGLSDAIGKWILFADCDDFYKDGFLSELDRYSQTDIDMLCFDVYYAYDLVCKQEKSKNRYSLSIHKYMENPTVDNLLMVKHIIQGPWNFMVRRNIPIDNNIWFEEIPKGNDAYFHHKVSMLCSKVSVTPQKLYYWLFNSNSITNKKISKENFNKSLSRQKKIIDILISAGAWNAIPSFFCNLKLLLRNYGLIYALQNKYNYLFCGIPWVKIWYNKLF